MSRLERSIRYYTDVVGLETVGRVEGRVTLGTAERALLVLVEEPNAVPATGFTGLYHFALLLPERIDLARWLAHAGRDGVQLVGLSDHFVSEALYLSDPDGHGIEIYWDRPRSVWEGQVASRMTTLPLDIESLLSELPDPASASFDGLPQETVMGHVHLKVAAIPETIAFYDGLLGFALMAQLGGTAAFLSAGGYHHHIGANTWESAGAPAPPPGTAALRQATVLLPQQAELERVSGRLRKKGHRIEETSQGFLVRDPSGNPLAFTLRG